jgi:hypothetical protein
MSDVDRTALRLELRSEKDLPILSREPPEKSTFLPVRSPARQEVSAQCLRGSRCASPLPSSRPPSFERQAVCADPSTRPHGDCGIPASRDVHRYAGAAGTERDPNIGAGQRRRIVAARAAMPAARPVTAMMTSAHRRTRSNAIAHSMPMKPCPTSRRKRTRST